MPIRRSRKTTSLMTKAAEIAMAVPPVVAHRVTRMTIAGPVLSERDRKEFARMSEEKAAAFRESWMAMATQALRANQVLAEVWLRAFWSPSLKRKLTSQSMARQMQSAALGVLGKGMAPVHRRAVANAKRLGRTKLR
ncbi:MAG: polyhydroxyalkanoate granule-associated phasin [Burkholderiaceae bacterium]